MQAKMALRDFLVVLFCFTCSLTIAVLGSDDGGDDSIGGGLHVIASKEWTDTLTSNGKMLVVFVKASGCPSCQETLEVVSSLIGDPELDQDLKIGQSSDLDLASAVGVTSFPTIVFLRENSHVFFDDNKPSAESLLEWLELSRSKVTHELHDDSFEHLTQASTGATTGDWLVAFYKDTCSHVLPLIESLGVRIRQRTNVAVVDSSKNNLLVDRFSIRECPEIILFKQGKMYRYEIPRLDQPSLKSFVDAWHVNSKAETVLPPKSKFDYLTEFLADNLKAQLEGKNRHYVIGGMCGVVGLFLIIPIICCCCCGGSGKGKQKTE